MQVPPYPSSLFFSSFSLFEGALLLLFPFALEPFAPDGGARPRFQPKKMGLRTALDAILANMGEERGKKSKEQKKIFFLSYFHRVQKMSEIVQKKGEAREDLLNGAGTIFLQLKWTWKNFGFPSFYLRRSRQIRERKVLFLLLFTQNFSSKKVHPQKTFSQNGRINTKVHFKMFA